MTPCQAYVPGAFAPSLPYGSLKPKVVPPPLSTMVKPRPSSKFSKAVWAQGDGEELNQQVLQQHSCTNHGKKWEDEPTFEYEFEIEEDDQEELLETNHHAEKEEQEHDGREAEDHAETNEYDHDPHDDTVRMTQRHLDILVDVRDLRYSQVSCGEFFQDGRAVEQLVTDLMDGTVDLSASFLRLHVFEDITRKTKVPVPILKCSDNRRLFALKKYAKKSGQTVMVRAQVYDQQTIRQVKRMVANSDDTDGESLRMRLQTNKPKSKNSNHGSSGSVKRKRNRNRHRR